MFFFHISCTKCNKLLLLIEYFTLLYLTEDITIQKFYLFFRCSIINWHPFTRCPLFF